MYDELVKRLIEHDEYGKTLRCGTGEIFKEAADAIIELEDRLAIADEDRIKFFLQIPRWIPVTEDLPKIGKKVLVFAYQNDVLTARLQKQTENGFPVFECNGIFLEMAKPGRITHWMPLPEPPKEET